MTLRSMNYTLSKYFLSARAKNEIEKKTKSKRDCVIKIIEQKNKIMRAQNSQVECERKIVKIPIWIGITIFLLLSFSFLLCVCDSSSMCKRAESNEQVFEMQNCYCFPFADAIEKKSIRF